MNFKRRFLFFNIVVIIILIIYDKFLVLSMSPTKPSRAFTVNNINNFSQWNVNKKNGFHNESNIFPSIDPNGYLLYHSHSGFSNQWLSFRTALLFAAILNKTLVLMPFMLGKRAIFEWRSWPILESFLTELQSDWTLRENIGALNLHLNNKMDPLKNFVTRLLDSELDNTMSSCQKFFHFNYRRHRFNFVSRRPFNRSELLNSSSLFQFQTDWDLIDPHDLFNLSSLSKIGIKYIYFEDFQNIAKLFSSMSIPNSNVTLFNYKDWIILPDCNRYQYQYFDKIDDFQMSTTPSLTSTGFSEDELSQCLWNETYERKYPIYINYDQVCSSHSDNNQSDVQLFKYYCKVDLTQYLIPKLQAIETNLSGPSILSIGSLFGTARLKVKLPFHRYLKYQISQSLIFYSNPLLELISNLITQSQFLGGSGRYLSVHFRSGDSFSSQLVDTFNNLIATLLDELDDANFYRRVLAHFDINNKNMHWKQNSQFKDLLDQMIFPNRTNDMLEGLRPLYHPSEWTLYVATDMKNFYLSSEFARLSSIFKQVITIDVFFPIFDRLNLILNSIDLSSSIFQKSYLLWYRKRNRGLPNTSYRLYVPLIDQIVAAHSCFFVGTNGSTFSAFIQKQHTTLIKRALRYYELTRSNFRPP